MTTSYLATLARLELLRIRAFWRFASRDLVFDVCVLAGLAVAYRGVFRVYELTAHQPPPLRLAVAAAVGAILFFTGYAGEGSKARERLIAGPFHELVCEPGRMDRWMTLRAAGYSLAGALAIALALVITDPLAAGLFLVAAVAGAAACALAISLRPAPRAKSPAAVRTQRAPRFTPRHPLAITALSALRRGPVPPAVIAAALIGLGGAAAGLASRNNHAPEIGYAIAPLAAILAGGALFPRGRLPGMLGQQPLSLPRLYLWLYAAPLAAALLGGVAAGVIGALGPVTALEVGVAAFTGLFIVSWFAFLHRLIRSQRHAALSTGVDFAGALFLASVENTLGLLWLVARGLILLRSAGRRRWLDR